MLVEVEGGKLKTVGGDKDNPGSQGFFCVRGRSTSEIFGNPRRLLYPQIRDDRRTNTWRRRVSWDEALDFIVKRVRTVGPGAVGRRRRVSSLRWTFRDLSGFVHTC
jgi:anaerobic selenocysteine-containing dehydrogenase